MYAFGSVELAGVLAVGGRSVFGGDGRLPEAGIQQYWLASRCRFDRWLRALRRLQDNAAASPSNRAANGSRPFPVAQEILTSEILTRIWTAVACAHDRCRSESYVAPILKNIQLGHLDVRQRLLNMILQRGWSPQSAVNVDRLRCHCERWTDLLLAYLLPCEEAGALAFDTARVQDFAHDVSDERSCLDQPQTWRLVHAALRQSFPDEAGPDSLNGDLNQRIASGIIACFDQERLDVLSPRPMLWMDRLDHMIRKTQTLLDELCAVG